MPLCSVRVVFRRVHLVWVLVVIPVSASTLAALQVLEQATRVCVAAVRSLEVTPEKLTKKFPEVRSLSLVLLVACSLLRQLSQPIFTETLLQSGRAAD